MAYNYDRTAADDLAAKISYIDHLVFQKAYTKALQEAAELTKDSNLVKTTEALHKLYILQKGTPSKNLKKYVGELVDEVLAKAASKLEAEDLKALKVALGDMPL